MMPIEKRKEVERKIATAFIKEAFEAGYQISVDNGEGETGPIASVDGVLKAMFLTDDERLRTWKNGKRVGWVWLVYGNDGWDVIADYSANVEKLMKVAQKLSDHYARR